MRIGRRGGLSFILLLCTFLLKRVNASCLSGTSPLSQIPNHFIVCCLPLLLSLHIYLGEPETTTTLIRKGARNIRDSKACLLALWTCPFSTVSGNKSRQSVPGEISWTWQWCSDLILFRFFFFFCEKQTNKRTINKQQIHSHRMSSYYRIIIEKRQVK